MPPVRSGGHPRVRGTVDESQFVRSRNVVTKRINGINSRKTENVKARPGEDANGHSLRIGNVMRRETIRGPVGAEVQHGNIYQ